MTERKTGAGANPAHAARAKRLAEALRANLRRRKQAARAGASSGEAESGRPSADSENDATAKDEAG